MNLTDIPLSNRVDWFRVIVDLERSGMSQAQIGAAVGRSQAQINNYKTIPDTEPRFHVGLLLLALWWDIGGDPSGLPLVAAAA